MATSCWWLFRSQSLRVKFLTSAHSFHFIPNLCVVFWCPDGDLLLIFKAEYIQPHGNKLTKLIGCFKWINRQIVWLLTIHWLVLLFIRQVYPKAASDWPCGLKEGFCVQEVSVKHWGLYYSRVAIEGLFASMEICLFVKCMTRFSMSYTHLIWLWRTAVRMFRDMITSVEPSQESPCEFCFLLFHIFLHLFHIS